MFSVLDFRSFFNQQKQDDFAFKTDFPQDVFYQLSYLSLIETTQDGDIFIASFRDERGEVYYPFVKRKILSTGPRIDRQFYDIITPFEYGGPVSTRSNDAKLMRDFLVEFTSFCEKDNIVSEFIRMHPFLCKQEALAEHYEVIENCQNIYVDLKQSEAEIFENASSIARRNIRVGKRQGIKVRSLDLSEADSFKKLYLDTMDRLNASRQYYFSDMFFETLKISPKGQFRIYNAYSQQEKLLASILLIGQGDIAHYYLGARKDVSRQEYVGNEYLFYEAICQAKEEGFEVFHLGGAGKGQDGLLRFKNSFSKDRVPYYTARKIYNSAVYSMLSNNRQLEYASRSGFFPAYRT